MVRPMINPAGGSVSAADAQHERRPGLRAVGAAAARVVRPIVARRGGGILGRLKTDWRAIAGDDLAASAWPEALGRSGVLKLRALPHTALDLQHRTPLVIERINLFFGRSVVTRIAVVQGPLPLAAVPSATLPAASLSPTETTALDARIEGIADPALRAALRELGHLVLAVDP
jgi:hypothetical protein